MENSNDFRLVKEKEHKFYSISSLFDMRPETPIFIKKVMILNKELLN